jgi:hypothetical protein
MVRVHETPRVCELVPTAGKNESSHVDPAQSASTRGWEPVAVPFFAMMAVVSARSVSGRRPVELLESTVVFQ